MDISFALFLVLVLAILAQAIFLARLQFIGCNLELEILDVGLPFLQRPLTNKPELAVKSRTSAPTNTPLKTIVGIF